jgi:hypothetical protein
MGGDPEAVQLELEGAAATARGAAVKTAPLSVRSEAGRP